MVLLSHYELAELVQNGVIENADLANVNSASIDLTLGDYVVVERPHIPGDQSSHVITLRDRTPLHTETIDITKDGYVLGPGEFILAQTKEIFNLPLDISAEYKLKSSMARIGLEHLNAGWCDAGWHGSVLTLELINVTRSHYIKIQTGDKIGQIVFFKHAEVPFGSSYAVRGRYNKDKTVTEIKP